MATHPAHVFAFHASALTQKAYRNIVRQQLSKVFIVHRPFRSEESSLGQKYRMPLTNCTIRSNSIRVSLLRSSRSYSKDRTRRNSGKHVMIIIQMGLTFLRVQYIRRIRWQGRTMARTQTRLYRRKRTSRARRIPKTTTALRTYHAHTTRFYRENYFK